VPGIAVCTGSVIEQVPLAGMLAPLKVTVLVVFVNETAAPPQVVDGASASDPDDVVAMLRLAGSVSVRLDCVSAKPLEL